MTFQLLISCMHQNDKSILYDSNITSDVVVVNQCDQNNKEEFKFADTRGIQHNVLWIDTTDRGLSRSRNMAIANATADICMIADDDQFFDSDIESVVISEYKKQDNSDVLIFGARYKKKQISSLPKKLNYMDLFRVSSVQITFKRVSIKSKVLYDIKLGAGTPNGAGEENKFLLDCLKNKLSINFTPLTLFNMREGNPSTWLQGFNEDFFYKRGMVARYTLGLFVTLAYIPYYVFKKLNRIECSAFMALYNSYKGCFQNKLSKE